MKHTLKVTFLLAFAFFAAQAMGLSITNKYIDHKTTAISGNVTFTALPYNLERPELNESTSYIWIVSAIIAGTLLLLLLIKFGKISWWKLWFFIAVFSTMSIAFSAFMNHTIAAILAFSLALIKIYKPITIIQNLTEIFIYGGLAAIFVPIINVSAAFMLLTLISIYDIIAVRHTKHMVKMARFQAKSNVFAGLFIPYGKKEKGKISAKEKGIMPGKEGGRIAVLGGGDIGLPLIFAGVVMKGLMLENTELIGLLKSLVVPAFTTLSLLFLLIKGKKEKFYPAMPYLTVGCAAGYVIILLLF